MAKESYVYEMRSINLANLPPNEAEGVIARFERFLNSLSETITFYVIEDRREVAAGEDTYEIPYKRFFVETPVSIEGALASLGTKVVRVPGVPRLSILHVSAKFMVDGESQLVQVVNVTRLGASLDPGFLTLVYPVAHEIRMVIEPIEVYDAKKVSGGHALSLGSKIMLRQSEGWSVDPGEQIEYQRTQAAAQLIAAGAQRLFRIRLSLVLRAPTSDALKEKRRMVRQTLGSVIGEYDSPRYLQWPLYAGRGPDWAIGRKFYAPTSSLSAFFPFSGLDIIDPGGVFIGQNQQTGNAIIYDVFEKENYNVAVAGATGAGKSVLIKAWISRQIFTNPDAVVFMFDSLEKEEYAKGPDGTYENSFGGLTKCRVCNFAQQEGLGLDPFSVFPRRQAGEFLASLLKVEKERSLREDMLLAAEKSSSIDDLYSNATPELKKSIDANIPDYDILFKGRMELFKRMIFVIKDLPTEEMRDVASFLALSAVWNMIETLPVSTKKIIVVDEGWSLIGRDRRTGEAYSPLASDYVPEIARTARHYNTMFLVATQRVADFIGPAGSQTHGPGRTMFEQSATKVLLRQDQAAEGSLREAFKLSEVELKRTYDFGQGYGLLMTPEGHVPFYNLLSDKELSLFTTAPKEMKT